MDAVSFGISISMPEAAYVVAVWTCALRGCICGLYVVAGRIAMCVSGCIWKGTDKKRPVSDLLPSKTGLFQLVGMDCDCVDRMYFGGGNL